jgi:hypothetical protein
VLQSTPDDGMICQSILRQSMVLFVILKLVIPGFVIKDLFRAAANMVIMASMIASIRNE